MHTTSRAWAEVAKRKSERYARVGVDMENMVATFLRTAASPSGDLIFEKVVRHGKNSSADRVGKDITVYKKVGDLLLERSFGITTSLNRFHKTKKKHEGTPVFYTPLNYNPQSFLTKVLDLFTSTS